jgi:pyruvate,water dikinase
VSPGAYEGTARVVRDEDDFELVQPGDVMVCPITSPVWSVVFPSLGALVCDGGGAMSHPAVIAREFGIPAVVATVSGTTTITDGSRVRVDGRSGHVTLLS